MNDLHILKSFDELVTELNETQGTLAKVELLRAASDLRPLIKRIWDPETKTHVTRKGLETWYAKKDMTVTGVAPKDLYSLMDGLTSGTLSGDRGKSAVWLYIKQYPKYEDMILRIAEKNPRIRLGATMLLQAFPGIFHIFRVALAQEWTEPDFGKAYREAGGAAWISKKIDGMRLVCRITAGAKRDTTNPDGAVVRFFSRKGHEVTSLAALRDDVISELVPFFTEAEITEGRVIDGEVVALDDAGREDFKLTVSAARKKDVTMENPRYKMFDLMPAAVFDGTATGERFGRRLVELQSLVADAHPRHCELLQQTKWTEAAFKRLAAEAARESWEGLMIRTDCLYERKRSRNLLKYKFTKDAEYTVDDVVIERMPFANRSGGEDMIDAVASVVITHKNGRVNVGSGFDRAERIEFARHPDKIRGHTITVKYQEEFQDEKTKKWSLRCPIFKGIVGRDEREV